MLEIKISPKREIMLEISVFILKRMVIEMNLFTKQKLSHRCGQQAYGHQRGNEERGVLWETETDIFILL